MAKPRVLLFCHDGTGLGHLRRISRLAGTLQEKFSTLVLCGMREAAWIVPPECGLIKLPDWDGIDGWRAERAGRVRWVDLSRSEAILFRAQAICRLAELYRPDVIIVDYLPFGQRRELEALFSARDTLRYFLHRGLTDTSDSGVLRGAATREIAASYDRILVASDPRMADIAAEDDYCDEAKSRISYVGFIGPKIEPRGKDWFATVVCSGGGGHLAEGLMVECTRVAERNPDIPFRIVLGPKSRISPSSLRVPRNCEVYGTRQDLPELHRNAAVVISSGGYNSSLEAASGGARLIIHPSRTGDDDEQIRFAVRLSRYHPVYHLERLDSLEEVLRANWLAFGSQSGTPPVLEMSGAERIRELLQKDLKHRMAEGSA